MSFRFEKVRENGKKLLRCYYIFLVYKVYLIVEFQVKRVPAVRGFWDFEKTALRKNRFSGTVGGPLLTLKSPTCAYIGQNRGSRGPR